MWKSNYKKVKICFCDPKINYFFFLNKRFWSLKHIRKLFSVFFLFCWVHCRLPVAKWANIYMYIPPVSGEAERTATLDLHWKRFIRLSRWKFLDPAKKSFKKYNILMSNPLVRFLWSKSRGEYLRTHRICLPYSVIELGMVAHRCFHAKC